MVIASVRRPNNESISFPAEDDMRNPNWWDAIDAAVTVCDRDGVILEMNERSKATFASDGGGALVGKNLFDCHGPASAALIRALIEEGRTNAYTIEKGGVRKLIYQTPWYDEGAVAGLVELSIVLPERMPHHVREG
jgi:transcriptional regulator with PAS, ATPase and Fis domain